MTGMKSMKALKVSLIVPIYNEAPHLNDFLRQLDGLQLPCDKELVFVDDCSRDDSFKILSEFPFQSPHQIKRQPANAGKGAALREGFAMATGDFIGVQDADFEYSVDDVPALLVPLLENKADVVFGSRFKKSAPQVHRTFHYLVNRILTMLSNLLSGIYLTDMETCYKFFRAEILKNLKLESNRFGFEPEITAKVARLKIRMVELPISYFPRTYLDGKKITWKDGVAAVRHLLVFNLRRQPKDYVLATMPKKYQAARAQWL